MEELKGFDIPLIGNNNGLLIRIVLDKSEKQLSVVVLDNSAEEYVASTGFDFAMCGLFDFFQENGVGVLGHLRNDGNVVGEISFRRKEIILELEKYGLRYGLNCSEKHYEIISALFRTAASLASEEPKQ